MSKYQFVLHNSECAEFVERLRGLGMVDITTTEWEPSEDDRALILDVEAHAKAEKVLEEFKLAEEYDAEAKPFASGDEAYEAYLATTAKLSEIDGEIVEMERVAQEAKPWGVFSAEALAKLESEGLKLNYFVTTPSAYAAIESEDLTIVKIAEEDSRLYFIVVTRDGEQSDLTLDAQLLKPLTLSQVEAEERVKSLKEKRGSYGGELSRQANSLSLIAERRATFAEALQLSRVSSSAEQAAEGSLLVMEAWAEEDRSKDVDALLDSQEGLFYIKSKPTPEDNTPVKLQNNRFARLFEMIGDLYARPKYGTIDLTPFFAPFYMLFFAICLCDAGYGAVILAAGLGLYFKAGESMRQAGLFTIVCGAAAVLFGFFANSLFGMEISSAPMFENFRFINFQQDFFSASMIIGLIQILFGMLVNIVVTTRVFGFKYALGSLGWFIMIASLAFAAVGFEWFTFSSIAFYGCVGVGFAMLLLLNSPEKNIFANVGSGLWETYDRTTGLLSDVLSYIRLFAIGLSGGVLALVFNNFAIGMTGLDASWADMSVVSLVMKIIGASLILLLGHGINLFMSTISAFVHPMRLTFVEFYKNAGFEMTTRKFEPLSSEKE